MVKLSLYNYRYMLGLAGVPSIIQFIGFLWLPESPRWLVEKGREQEARKALVLIRKTPNVDIELEGIKQAIAEHRQEQEEGKFYFTQFYPRWFSSYPAGKQH